MDAAWADWLSYRPSDFLMFAPRTYWRLFELQNQALWPVLLVWAAAGAALGLAGWRRRRPPGAPVAAGWPLWRAGAGLLAAAWAFVGASFLLQRYVPINWAAQGLVALFGLQALVLAALGLHAPAAVPAQGLRRAAAAALGAAALVLYPWLAPLAGRPGAQGEWFGLAPDPTVLATLAWLLAREPPAVGSAERVLMRGAWTLALVAAAASAATLATMGSAQWLAPALGGVLAAAAATCPRSWGRRRPRA